MWVLRNVHNNEEKCFKMPSQGKIKVGRKDSDLCLGGNDHSISRHHAELSIVAQDGEEFLQVEDMGSRYGTYINNNIQPINCPKAATNNKMEPNTKILLKSGDKVRFGLQWHIWFVYKYTYIVSSSKLDAALSTKLQGTLQSLNIPFQTDWDAGCTHLTMSGIVVTPKVACALASTKHIVTLDFWSELSRVLSCGSGFYPKEEDYLPPVLEKAAKCDVVSFLPDPARSSLFAGLRFVALSQQQMKYFERCITLAGGTIVSIHREKFTKRDLLDENTIVLSKTALHVESQQTQVDAVVDRLRDLFAKSQKRLVDEAEIGFAIIFVSRQSACNPYAAFTLPQMSQEPSQHTLVEDSEHVFSVSMIKTPRSARKRDRSPSPPSERKQSKLTSASTLLTPAGSDHSVDMMTFRDTEKVVGSATRRGVESTQVLDSASSDSVEVETETPRVVESAISTAPGQSEVYEMEDESSSNVDEVDRATARSSGRSRRLRERERGSTNLDTGECDSRGKRSEKLDGKTSVDGSSSRKTSTRHSESTGTSEGKLSKFGLSNDSSEDELENLFSKCQQLSKKRAFASGVSKGASSTLVSEATKSNASSRTRGSRESNQDEEMCSSNSTNLERGSSSRSASEETRDSVFQMPTQRVSSRTTRSKILSGGSLDGWLSKEFIETEPNDRTTSRDKESHARQNKETNSRESTEETLSTQLSRASTSIRLNAYRLASSDEEEDIFEQSTLSRRHGNATLAIHSLAGTSSIRANNTLANSSVAPRTPSFSSRTNSMWGRNQEDEDEDNVFGAPTCKPLPEIGRLGRRNLVNSTETLSDSDGTCLSSNRLTPTKSQRPTLSRKRMIEEESGEMLRTAELQSLQDRGFCRDEADYVGGIDTSCCVISVQFPLKKYTITPFLENKKTFKKQSLPGRANNPKPSPLKFQPVFAMVLDDIVKSEPQQHNKSYLV